MAFSMLRQSEPTPPSRHEHALIVNHCHSLTSLDPLLLPHAIKRGMAAFVHFKWDLNPVLLATSADGICVNNPFNCCPHRRPHHQHIFLDWNLMNNCTVLFSVYQLHLCQFWFPQHQRFGLSTDLY